MAKGGEGAAAGKRREFAELLGRLFQLDCADLDFGVYRIMKLKSAVIKERLIDGIGDVADRALGGAEKEVRDRYKAELAEAREFAREILKHDAIDDNGVLGEQYRDTGAGKAYLKAQRKAAAALARDEVEVELFNHLLRFFDLHYEDGDFMPRRRASKRGAYSLPYNGEDVHLHWANRGQYYIKSAPQFSSYAFNVAGGRVRFVVRDAADMPKDNNKGGKRLFFPMVADVVLRAGEAEIPLQHRAADKKDKIKNDKAAQEEIIARAEEEAGNVANAKKNKILAAMLQKDAGEDRTPFAIHLRRYARGSDSDFFIHKDLRGFLSGALDAYIKNEALKLDELGVMDEVRIVWHAALVRALREIGNEIITFLAQFEGFQKTLWEKKKFVTETNYIVRLGALDDKTREAVVGAVVNNEGQWQEWKQLGMLGDDAAFFAAKQKDKARREWLANNPAAPLDTAHFGETFALQLLAAFDDIDASVDGVVIHGDNFQALNLLSGRFRGMVQCVYIDPPYNTDSSPILYKNNYKDSSWLTMMENRLALTRALLSENGVFCCAIDDAELRYLTQLADTVFGLDNYLSTVTTLCNPQGRVADNVNKISEYHVLYAENKELLGDLAVAKINGNGNGNGSKNGNGADGVRLCRTGTTSRRSERPRRFYPILYKDGTLSMINDEEYGKIYDAETRKFDDDFVAELQSRYEQRGYQFILPVSQSGEKLVWHRQFSRVKQELDSYFVRSGVIYTPSFDEEVPKTLWHAPQFSNPEYGSELVKHILGEKSSGNTAKSVYTVMRFCSMNNPEIVVDYFAGSGTTAHAVMNLNREDDGKRKFVLAEMGEYFDGVLLPRIKKVMFTPEWKDGEPSHNGNGGDIFEGKGEPRLIKYHRIESYEDALDNIHFDEDAALWDEKDYEARYMLEWESKDCATFANGEALNSPFPYKLRLVKDGKDEYVNADLPETFNYLAGMHLRARRKVQDGEREYLLDCGVMDGKETVIVWRDTTGWEDADYDGDREFLQGHEWVKSARMVYTNGDSRLKAAQSLNPLFKKLMFGESNG